MIKRGPLVLYSIVILVVGGLAAARYAPYLRSQSNVTIGNPQCVDGFRFVECPYPHQPGCFIQERCAEQCADGVDNDGDGVADRLDISCHSLETFRGKMWASRQAFYDAVTQDQASYQPERTTEVGGPGCADGKDNDQDKLIDDADPGCSVPAYDPFESESGESECSDGLNNDKDRGNLIDAADPGCHEGGHLDNPYRAGEDEIGGIECSDGANNDPFQDDRIDRADAGCHYGGIPWAWYQARDQSETGEATCADGRDNDRDGVADDQDTNCHIAGWLRAPYMPRRIERSKPGPPPDPGNGDSLFQPAR